MRLARRIFYAICFVALLSTPVLAGASGEDIVLMTDGWSYRWGDSPVDSSGRFIWLNPSTGGWQPLRGVEWPENRGSNHWIWYRCVLPEGQWEQPVLFLPNVIYAFEVFLEDQKIYTFGVPGDVGTGKYSVVEVHTIPLPADAAGKTLFVRIFSDVAFIGIDGAGHPPSIGNDRDIVRSAATYGFSSIAFGILFVFAGVFAFLMFLMRPRSGSDAPLRFAVFTTCFGTFYIASATAFHMLVESPVLKLYMLSLSFMYFPVAMYAYLLSTIFRHAGVMMRRTAWVLFWVHASSATALLALDLVGVQPVVLGMAQYNLLFAGSVIILLFMVLSRAMKGSHQARIVTWGFTAFGVLGLLDILQGLGVISFWSFSSHWGALVFVASLAYVLERDFLENHKRLKEYSSELEQKSQQLEEYSRTLEERVARRTADLDSRNRELHDTLAELKQMQQQLVMREKMASLGSLVAGVAHEVNNPIGAVVSASDVSSRCVEVVREYVADPTTDGRDRVIKASQLLAENNRVVSEAARRVAEIVKSLKNFARLDEAQFQYVDIHEGLDSTLIMVRHLLADRIKVQREYGDLPHLAVYPNQLNQVFMNIIVNAIEAIDGSGAIRVRTHQDGERAFIRITDTGPGIAAENMERIFDPGYTTKGVGVGTGLGLSISYSIIDSHHGRLYAESEAGKGTTFTIELPVRVVPPQKT